MTPHDTYKEMMLTEYSGKPIVQIVLVLAFLSVVILAGTHLFMFLIDKL